MNVMTCYSTPLHPEKPTSSQITLRSELCWTAHDSTINDTIRPDREEEIGKCADDVRLS